MITVTQKIGMVGLLNVLFLSTTASISSVYAQTQSSDALLANPVAAEGQADLAQPAAIAQVSEDDAEAPERINYFGIGGTIGLSNGADTALGEGGFSLVGRFSITENISVHSASVINDDSIFSFALTGGAPIRNKATGRTIVYPFLGAGILGETDDFDIDPLISAGVDVPITDIVTGTARVNTSFGNDGTDVGLVLGVGVDLFELF